MAFTERNDEVPYSRSFPRGRRKTRIYPPKLIARIQDKDWVYFPAADPFYGWKALNGLKGPFWGSRDPKSPHPTSSITPSLVREKILVKRKEEKDMKTEGKEEKRNLNPFRRIIERKSCAKLVQGSSFMKFPSSLIGLSSRLYASKGRKVSSTRFGRENKHLDELEQKPGSGIFMVRSLTITAPGTKNWRTDPPSPRDQAEGLRGT